MFRGPQVAQQPVLRFEHLKTLTGDIKGGR